MKVDHQKIGLSQLKEHIINKNVQLAKLDQNNRPVKMQTSTSIQVSLIALKQNQTYKSTIETLSIVVELKLGRKMLMANKYFKSNEVQKALETYLQSLIGLERKGQADKVAHVKQQLEYPILMNIVSCFYRKKQFQKGLQICDEVINDSNNTYLQAFYKKAYLLYEIGQYKSAKQILMGLLLKIQSKTMAEKITLRDITDLFKKIIEKTKQQQKMYKRIFREIQEEQNIQKDAPNIISFNQSICNRVYYCIKSTFTNCLRKYSKNIVIKQENEQNAPLISPELKRQ